MCLFVCKLFLPLFYETLVFAFPFHLYNNNNKRKREKCSLWGFSNRVRSTNLQRWPYLMISLNNDLIQMTSGLPFALIRWNDSNDDTEYFKLAINLWLNLQVCIFVFFCINSKLSLIVKCKREKKQSRYCTNFAEKI